MLTDVHGAMWQKFETVNIKQTTPNFWSHEDNDEKENQPVALNLIMSVIQ